MEVRPRQPIRATDVLIGFTLALARAIALRDGDIDPALGLHAFLQAGRG